jgi:tetratricopeptide (TPR) repeat protein
MATLQSHALLLGAVSMMHRTAKPDFFRAKDLLLHLHERHQRQPVISAWLAKWYVLQVEQGWTDDARVAANHALDNSKRALDLDPDSPLALSMDGFVRCNLMKDFDTALQQYEHALRVNPNESIAWLLKGMLHAFRGEGAPAVAAADKAIVLSPLDPTRYFYDSLSASIHLTAGNYGVSIKHAQRSLRANSTHVSTYRALTIAQVMDGQVDSARQTAVQLMRLDPGLTVRRFLARSPGVKFGIGKTFADALGVAGVPA